MGKRNLRRWAEAKARRSEQQAEPQGHWFGRIFIEAPELGTPVAPPTFLPFEPAAEELPPPCFRRGAA